MNDAGRIGFVIKGEYGEFETYDFLDVVYFEGNSYVAKKLTIRNEPNENDEYWQILAKGAVEGVTGVKGAAESDYRNGDVNLTPEDIGALSLSGGSMNKDSSIYLNGTDGISYKIQLSSDDGYSTIIRPGEIQTPSIYEGGTRLDEKYLSVTGDSKDNTVTYTSEDAESPTSWAQMALFNTGEKISVFANKVSNMAKNVRYLYRMLGTTDISSIGNGTVTGAINQANATANTANTTANAAQATANTANTNLSLLNKIIGESRGYTIAVEDGLIRIKFNAWALRYAIYSCHIGNGTREIVFIMSVLYGAENIYNTAAANLGNYSLAAKENQSTGIVLELTSPNIKENDTQYKASFVYIGGSY